MLPSTIACLRLTNEHRISDLFATVAYGAFRLGQAYVRRSMGSYRAADKVRVDLMERATALIKQDIPESVGRAIVAIVSIIGYGCFVRGLIMSHYFPAAFLRPRVGAIAT